MAQNHIRYAQGLMNQLDREDNDEIRAQLTEELQSLADWDPAICEQVRSYGIPVD